MQVAIRVLTNTPVWVFPLLAYLIWQGQSLRPRTRSQGRPAERSCEATTVSTHG
jgi:hypothetical protein